MSSGGVCIVNDAAAEFVSTASIASLGLRCKTSSAIVPDMLASRAGVTVACLLWRPGACDQSRIEKVVSCFKHRSLVLVGQQHKDDPEVLRLAARFCHTATFVFMAAGSDFATQAIQHAEIIGAPLPASAEEEQTEEGAALADAAATAMLTAPGALALSEHEASALRLLGPLSALVDAGAEDICSMGIDEARAGQIAAKLHALLHAA